MDIFLFNDEKTGRHSEEISSGDEGPKPINPKTRHRDYRFRGKGTLSLPTASIR